MRAIEQRKSSCTGIESCRCSSTRKREQARAKSITFDKRAEKRTPGTFLARESFEISSRDV